MTRDILGKHYPPMLHGSFSAVGRQVTHVSYETVQRSVWRSRAAFHVYACAGIPSQNRQRSCAQIQGLRSAPSCSKHARVLARSSLSPGHERNWKMEYMLLFHLPATDLERTPDDPASADYWESWRAYMGAIYSAGIVTSGNVLQPPSTATMVRFRDGQREVLDGPFAETKEMLGGYVIITVSSLEDRKSVV